ncbi:MAG: hypothetical protein Q8K74_02015 [Candidatus Nitrotoga sp.]|nr:hypothetical protein [Candidatus Nitrotoga sp.]MDP1854810.1 hypothetical protein [Candidatus Nitrotoga sp.]
MDRSRGAKKTVDERFKSFHPFLTYSDQNNFCFIRSDGKSVAKLDDGTKTLFDLGRSAFDLLAEVKTKSRGDFDWAFCEHSHGLQSLRSLYKKKNFVLSLEAVKSEHKEEAITDWDMIDDNLILSIHTEMFFLVQTRIRNEYATVVRDNCLMNTLLRINDALTALELDASNAISNAVAACESFRNALAIDSSGEKHKHLKREIALKGAMAKHVKTKEIRKLIIDYWHEHIPPKTSNEKAGEWLKDSFPELSVRKLSEYVAQAKKEVKKVPPTSKA